MIEGLPQHVFFSLPAAERAGVFFEAFCEYVDPFVSTLQQKKLVLELVRQTVKYYAGELPDEQRSSVGSQIAGIRDIINNSPDTQFGRVTTEYTIFSALYFLPEIKQAATPR